MSQPVARRTHVLIVGAGPTGLALACDLRSRGIDVVVIDKATVPATTSRALGLQPRGAEILARLGALKDLPEKAIHPPALTISVGERRLVRIDVSKPAGDTMPGLLVIGQSEIEARLRARLAELGCEVNWGSELLVIESQGSHVNAMVRSENGDTVIGADWLVGCDGAHSRARKLAGISFEGAAFAERFILADVRLDWQRPATEPAVWLHRDGILAAFPLPGNVWRIMAELRTDDDIEVDESGSPSEPATRDLLYRFFHNRVGDRNLRIGEMKWRSVFRFHRRLASTYRQGRILLAGDAAHIHSPFGGQGMNTGLGDAYNLGWKLAMVIRGRSTEALLDTYEAERRPIAADVLATTTTNTSLLLGNTLVNRVVRDFLFLPALRIPAMRRKMAQKASQLNVSYAGGPLARRTLLSRLASIVRPRPATGARGPNAACSIHPQRKPTTLAEQVRSNWALLEFGAAGAASKCAAAVRARLGKDVRVIRILPSGQAITGIGLEGADVVLQDHCASIGEAYRRGRGETVLMRPDGHLAWTGSQADSDGLRKWLTLALGEEDPCTDLGWQDDMPLVPIGGSA